MGKRKINQEEYDNIVNLYKRGLTQQQIADKYNVSKDTIKEIFKKKNISKKDKPDLFSIEDMNSIITLYNGGKTTQEIGMMYNVADETIRRWLDKYGVGRRQSKYTIDEYYFDNIDDQNKAYFLGLLYADGYHNIQKHSISITLQLEDRHILESFSELMQSTRPLHFVNNNVKNVNWSDCYKFTIINKHVSDMMLKYGVSQAKSLTLDFPYWLSKELYPHFIRGYFDGDGHIVKSKYKYGMSIVGTERFCSALQNIFLNDLGVESHMYISTTPDKSTRTLMITNKRSSKIFFDYIYNDANLYLKRKHDVYKLKYYNNISDTLTA